MKNNVKLISISGKLNSGKDTVGKIMQYLTSKKDNKLKIETYLESQNSFINDGFEIKKFADKLKQIVSILTGIPVEDLEKQEVKDRVLGEEWDYFVATNRIADEFYNKDFISEYTNHCSTKNEAEYKIKKQLESNSNYKIEKLKYTVRQLLQEIGTEAMRNVIHPNIWVNALMSEYKGGAFSFKNGVNHIKKMGNLPYTKANLDKVGVTDYEMVEFPSWIITDMRFPNELKAVKDRGGISIRVNRQKQCGSCENTFTSKGDCPYCGSGNWVYGYIDDTHESETALDNHNFDYVIDNDGSISDLIAKVKEILIKEKII